MPAEMVRDNALAASGLLVNRIGGPSVRIRISRDSYLGRSRPVTSIPPRTRSRPTIIIAARCTRSSSATRRIRRMATFDFPDRGDDAPSGVRRRTRRCRRWCCSTIRSIVEAYRVLATHVLARRRRQGRADHHGVPAGDPPAPDRRGTDADPGLLRRAAAALRAGRRRRRERW